MVIVQNRFRSIGRLHEVPLAAVAAVESLHEPGEEVLHRPGQIGSWCFHQEVEVVREHAVVVELEVEPSDGLSQQRDRGVPVEESRANTSESVACCVTWLTVSDARTTGGRGIESP